MNRRHFLLGGGGTLGALVIGWAASPVRSRLLADRPLDVAPGQVALNGWVKVGADDSVTVVMSQAEMGQGTHTGIAMLVIEEMDAAWDQVRVEQSGSDAIYNTPSSIVDALPFFQPDDDGFAKRATGHVVRKILRAIPGLAATGGSSSIADQWWPLREAGAAARALLIAAAAARWNVPADACRAAAGRVLHASGRSASFGELAAGAARLPLPRHVRLKDPEKFTLIGKPVRRLENAAKLNGTAIYAIDSLPPDLLYADVVLCPTLGGKVRRFDAAAARALPGVRMVVELDPVGGGIAGVGMTSGGIAVIAASLWQAHRALERLTVEWDHGAAGALSSESLANDLSRALAADAGTIHLARGDAAAALKSAARTITAEYRVPLLAHATMEPMNCTARYRDGRLTVWAATQGPGFARQAMARALKLDEEKITLHVPLLGGGFGRRFFTDVCVQAAILARALDGPAVQLIWSRETDITHDFYRPAFLFRGTAGLDAQGRLLAWMAASAGSTLGAPSLLENATDGASNTAYAFPAARIAHHAVDPPLPLGIWRSVNHSQNAFFTECFLDECAAAAGQDPVAFRAALLVGDARHLRVLHRAAQLAGWSEPVASGPAGERRGRGIALHRCFGSIVAQVAEVSVEAEQRIRVHRVVCVVDCGFPVNPNLIRQQMEGAIVFGLSAALYGEITLNQGRVLQSNFHDYAPLRMQECPAMEVDIIASREPPGGVGETGTPPIAPAVANALFSLTGRRLRSLPLRLA